MIRRLVPRIFRRAYHKARRTFSCSVDCLLENFERLPNIPLHSVDGFKYLVDSKDMAASPRVIQDADKIVGHVFDLLGSGPTNLPYPIDWHVDFKSGYRWSPGVHWQNIEVPVGMGDIKVPWELSRLQHMPLLAEAYLQGKDEKYLREFRSQLEDWIRKGTLSSSAITALHNSIPAFSSLTLSFL